MRRRDDHDRHDHSGERVVSALRRALQQALVEGLADPRLDGVMVSVTGGSLSPDGLAFTAGISVLPEQAGPLPPPDATAVQPGSRGDQRGP